MLSVSIKLAPTPRGRPDPATLRGRGGPVRGREGEGGGGEEGGSPTEEVNVPKNLHSPAKLAIASGAVFKNTKRLSKEGCGRGKFSMEAQVFDHVDARYPHVYDNRDHFESACAIFNR